MCIRDRPQHELRDRIGYVPQKGVLFSGTIESNIKYGCPEAPDQVMEEAARIAPVSYTHLDVYKRQGQVFVVGKSLVDEAVRGKLHDPVGCGPVSYTHLLPEREEQILAMASPALETMDNAFTMLDSVDLKRGEVTDEEGHRVPLTDGLYSRLRDSRDRRVRAEAFEAMHNAFASMGHTIAALYACLLYTSVRK